MTFPDSIPQAAINLVLSFLLPLILPSTGGDTQAARDLALCMLAEHTPQTARELRLAAETIGYSLRGLTLLANSAEPGIAADKHDTALKWACSLSRSGHQAQRRLDQLQRPATRPAPRRTTGAPQDIAPPQETAAPPPPQTAPDQPPTVAQAEAALQSAEKLLSLMKAHHKGAPPPHSPVAQQIQAQQRLVDTARLKLQHARRQPPVPATQPLQAAA